jgi:phosphoglycolate phosphatase
MAIKNLLFDLDGTLWDTTEVCCKAWNLVAEERGLAQRYQIADVVAIMGLAAPDIAKKLFPNEELEVGLNQLRVFFKREVEVLAEMGGAIYPGVEETLAELSNTYRLYLVSNCQESYLEAFRAGSGIGHFFQDMECHGRTGKSKSENINLLMEKNHLLKEESVYVGDTTSDEEAAVRAGLPLIYAAYGFGQVKGDHPAIERFSDLPAALDRL